MLQTTSNLSKFPLPRALLRHSDMDLPLAAVFGEAVARQIRDAFGTGKKYTKKQLWVQACFHSLCGGWFAKQTNQGTEDGDHENGFAAAHLEEEDDSANRLAGNPAEFFFSKPDPALQALLAEQELDDDVEEEEHQTHHSAGKPASL